MSTAVTKRFQGSYLMPSLEHATVADAMHPGVLACDADASLSELARLMATNHVHCVVVRIPAGETSGTSPSYGVIADLEVLAAGLRAGAEPTAAALARHPTITVEPTTPLREAAELMLTHGERHVLVIGPGGQRPVGVLSTLDVAGVLAWGEA
jgi:CBS domain-containing protein